MSESRQASPWKRVKKGLFERLKKKLSKPPTGVKRQFVLSNTNVTPIQKPLGIIASLLQKQGWGRFVPSESSSRTDGPRVKREIEDAPSPQMPNRIEPCCVSSTCQYQRASVFLGPMHMRIPVLRVTAVGPDVQIFGVYCVCVGKIAPKPEDR